MEQIDFVITWVDGNDPDWQAEKNRCLPERQDNGVTCNRFRDWGLLRYWFRGVEAYAPWVHHVYFVTWGHIPPWLHIAHPKLTVVNHRDYIPEAYLPTFNSNVIELFLHRIPGLAEHFVLFNDDMFLTAPVRPEDFFVQGSPCEAAMLQVLNSFVPSDVFPHAMLNNMAIINSKYDKKEVLRQNWRKFYTPRYGSYLVGTLLLSPFRYFSSFRDLHLPTSHRKSTFAEVWDYAEEELLRCARQRFRSKDDVTHWLMKWWNLCQGTFVSRSAKWGRCFELGLDSEVYSAISGQKYHAVCLNDSLEQLDFEETRRHLQREFDAILPYRSGFERY